MDIKFKVAVMLAATFFSGGFVNGITQKVDMTVSYYSSVVLVCDSLAHNISDRRSDVDTFYWITADGSLISTSTGSVPKGMTLLENGYKLNITRITDDMFGYYHCIIKYRAMGEIETVRRGLNVNGADFSALHEQYKYNAMIGGIAAAVMVVLIGAGCLWYRYRYGPEEDERENLDLYKMNNEEFKRSIYEQTVCDDEAVQMEEKKAPPLEEMESEVLEARL